MNGKEYSTDKDTLTIESLLNELGIIPERVAVEVNLSVIKKKDYKDHFLKDGDRVEIVNFVGGGTWINL